MDTKTYQFELWPTKIMAFEFQDDLLHSSLKSKILEEAKKKNISTKNDELRIYNLSEISASGTASLMEHFHLMTSTYLGEDSKQHIDNIDFEIRAVVVQPGQFIQTHTEQREADLSIAYFLTGDGVAGAISEPSSVRFVLEDPSRHLNDLRLPFEHRHSVHLAPRPGLGLIFPSHVPHHQQPNFLNEPHIQIVCNVKIAFKCNYFLQKW